MMLTPFQYYVRSTSLVGAIEASKDAVTYLFQFQNAVARVCKNRALSGLGERESLQAMNDVAKSMIDDLSEGIDEYQTEFDKMGQ